MESLIIIMIISFMAGAMSYMIGRFWILPMFRYHKFRRQIASNIRICLSADNEEIRKYLKNHTEAHRRYSAELSDIVYELPQWYKMVLQQRSEFPDNAVGDIMKLSDISDPIHARKRSEKIMKSLKLTDGK